MSKIKIIRPIIASALLLLFIVSNTPKQILHDIFANHPDCIKKIPDGIGNNVSELKFHCQCDHLVVESPFTNGLSVITISQRFTHLEIIPSYYTFIVTDHHVKSTLRGPPGA
ncbi:MAG: hypothetical protein ABIN01_23315 [Ferruginibacter sp.]